MNRKQPILVTGSHRSGTTWVGRTIARHPQVRYIQEPFNLNNKSNLTGLKLDTWFVHVDSSPQRSDIEAAFDDLLRAGPLRRARAKTAAVGGSGKITRFAKNLALDISRPRVLVKDPLALLSADWMHQRYGCKVVCMIRSPLAFVGSLKKAEWDFDYDNLLRQKALMSGPLSSFAERINSAHGGDFIDRAVLLWNILHAVILDYQRRYPNWHYLRYEDIAAQPAQYFEALFAYLELDFSAAIRRYIEDYTSEQNPPEADSSAYQPRNAKQALNTWRERLSADEVQRVTDATASVAARFY